jgi:dGTPase
MRPTRRDAAAGASLSPRAPAAAGERALDQCLGLFGGFDHNAHTLHVVTSLERRYAGFNGLNLTWDTLEGLVKHNGPLTGRDGVPVERYRERGLPRVIAEYTLVHDLDLWSWPSAEAQAGAISDDIAYDAHDIDDGLRAGMFEIGDLAGLPLIGDILRDTAREHPRLDPSRHAHELVRRVITRMIEDVIAESRRRIAALDPKSAADIRNAGAPVIGFSAAFAEADKAIKAFLYPRLYRHVRIMRIMGEAEAVVRRLFERLVQAPADLPPEWLADLDPADAVGRALRIADYIAGMTDRYAIGEHARLLGWTPELK